MNGTQRPVNAVKHTIDLLYAFVGVEQEVSLATLSKKVALNKTTVHRSLQTLMLCDVVEQNPETKNYRLGPKVLQLAGSFLQNTDVRSVARPVLEELVWYVRETATLAIYRRDEIVFIDKVEGPSNVRFFCEVGRSLPLYVGAGARAVLAHLPPDQIQRYLGSATLTALTEHTLTDPEKLRADLAETRVRGYSISNQEVDLGVSGVGAPIINHEGRPVGAITVAGLSIHFATPEAVNKMGEHVRQAALTISRRLGHLG